MVNPNLCPHCKEREVMLNYQINLCEECFDFAENDPQAEALYGGDDDEQWQTDNPES